MRLGQELFQTKKAAEETSARLQELVESARLERVELERNGMERKREVDNLLKKVKILQVLSATPPHPLSHLGSHNLRLALPMREISRSRATSALLGRGGENGRCSKKIRFMQR